MSASQDSKNSKGSIVGSLKRKLDNVGVSADKQCNQTKSCDLMTTKLEINSMKILVEVSDHSQIGFLLFCSLKELTGTASNSIGLTSQSYVKEETPSSIAICAEPSNLLVAQSSIIGVVPNPLSQEVTASVLSRIAVLEAKLLQAEMEAKIQQADIEALRARQAEFDALQAQPSAPFKVADVFNLIFPAGYVPNPRQSLERVLTSDEIPMCDFGYSLPFVGRKDACLKYLGYLSANHKLFKKLQNGTASIDEQDDKYTYLCYTAGGAGTGKSTFAKKSLYQMIDIPITEVTEAAEAMHMFGFPIQNILDTQSLIRLSLKNGLAVRSSYVDCELQSSELDNGGKSAVLRILYDMSKTSLNWRDFYLDFSMYSLEFLLCVLELTLKTKGNSYLIVHLDDLNGIIPKCNPRSPEFQAYLESAVRTLMHLMKNRICPVMIYITGTNVLTLPFAASRCGLKILPIKLPLLKRDHVEETLSLLMKSCNADDIPISTFIKRFLMLSSGLPRLIEYQLKGLGRVGGNGDMWSCSAFKSNIEMLTGNGTGGAALMSRVFDYLAANMHVYYQVFDNLCSVEINSLYEYTALLGASLLHVPVRVYTKFFGLPCEALEEAGLVFYDDDTRTVIMPLYYSSHLFRKWLDYIPLLGYLSAITSVPTSSIQIVTLVLEILDFRCAYFCADKLRGKNKKHEFVATNLKMFLNVGSYEDVIRIPNVLLNWKGVKKAEKKVEKNSCNDALVRSWRDEGWTAVLNVNHAEGPEGFFLSNPVIAVRCKRMSAAGNELATANEVSTEYAHEVDKCHLMDSRFLYVSIKDVIVSGEVPDGVDIIGANQIGWFLELDI